MANGAELRRIVSLIDASPLEKRDPKDLLPYAQNSRTHSEYQIKQIADSIIEFGFTNPVLIDEKDEVIAGHGRIFAAMKLELPKVPVIVMSHLTPTQKKAYVIADNKLALNAGWDLDLLKLQLNELDNEQFDLTLTGFDDTELDTLLGEIIPANEGHTDPDAIPEVKETRCKPGDLWQLGNHRLLCGDSTDILQVERLMGGEKADICFTSPPYNLGENAKLRGYNGDGDDSAYNEKSDHKTQKEYLDFLNSFTAIAMSFCNLVFVNIQLLAGNKTALPEYWHGLRHHLVDLYIWDKAHAAPQMAARVLNSVFEFIFIFSSEENPKRSIKTGADFRGTIDNIFRLNPAGKKDKLAQSHGAVFPVQFAENFIVNHCDKSVYEPFSGSGSTLIACEKTGRKCYGCEIDANYCDVIIERYIKFVGSDKEVYLLDGEKRTHISDVQKMR